MGSLRLGLTVIVALVFVVLAMLFVGSLGQLYPGNLLVAILMGLTFFAIGAGAIRAATRAPSPDGPVEPEDVTDLDVFFVCRECGTEFRVEKLGELQVPRHCGEPMLVERRPAQARDGRA